MHNHTRVHTTGSANTHTVPSLTHTHTYTCTHTHTHLLGSGALIRRPTSLPHHGIPPSHAGKQAERTRSTIQQTHATAELEDWEVLPDPNNREMKKSRDSSRFFASEHQLLFAFNQRVHRFHHSFSLSPLSASVT